MVTLYQLLGRIFYAAAQADGIVQDEEVAILKSTVHDVWLDFETALDTFDTDAAYQIEIVFDYLYQNDTDLGGILTEVNDFKRIHASVFNPEFVELVMSTSYKIVSSFAKRNKSELVFLSQLRAVLEKT